MRFKSAALTAIAAVSLSGCFYYQQEPDFQSRFLSTFASRQDIATRSQWAPYSEAYTQRFVWKMRYLAEKIRSGSGDRAKVGLSVLMSTITPVDNLTRGTSFGRLVTEQLMTELNGAGFRVIEARKTTDYLLYDRVGEFSLSRDIGKIASQFSTDAVLVGTYSRSAEQALINVRLVDVKDSSTIAAASAMMDIRGDAFLESVLAEDENLKRPNPLASVGLRKKVIPETDHYSDTLHSMLKSMAGRISETAADEGGVKTIAVTTFVDVNHLYRASTFGRYVGEQLLTELSQQGFNVVEVRASPDIVVDLRLGEMGLTREAERLVPKGKADAIVVGTYTRAGDTALVNGRMILAKTGKVVGVGDIALDASPRNKFMASLFEQEITTVLPSETVEGY